MRARRLRIDLLYSAAGVKAQFKQLFIDIRAESARSAPGRPVRIFDLCANRTRTTHLHLRAIRCNGAAAADRQSIRFGWVERSYMIHTVYASINSV